MSDSLGGSDMSNLAAGASIPLQAGRGVPAIQNPLAQLQQSAGTINQLNSLRAFPGQMQLQQQAIQGGALDLATRTNQAVYAGLTPYLSDPTFNHAKLTTALAALESSGVPTSGVISRLTQVLPPEDGPGFVQAVRNTVGAGALRDPQQQLNYVLPGQGQVNTGQQMQGVSIAPQSSATPGAITPQGNGVQLVTGPDTNAQLQPSYAKIPDPNNPGNFIYQPIMSPRSALPGASGVAGPGAAVPQTPGPPPSPQNPPRLPGAVQQPGAAQQPGGVQQPGAPSPTASGAPAGSILAAPPPNVSDAQQQDTKLFKADQMTLPAKQTAVQNLQHAYDALQLTTGSGKTPEATSALYNYLQSAGLLPPGATNNLANYELFRKYTERNVADLGNAAGTDAGRALAAQSNAGTSLSTPANLAVLRNDIGKQRQAIAQTMTAPDQTSGIGYSGYAGNFANNTDPRGFQWDLIAPAQQQQILSGMKPNTPAWNKLHRAIGMAAQLGLFNPSAAAAAPQGQ